MADVEPDRLVLRFVNEINRHDLDALRELVAPDVWYTDAGGQELRGQERLLECWRSCFSQCPDYRIAIREHVAVGSLVALFGVASGGSAAGSPLSARWTTPAAWRAVVRGGHIAEWQVFADHEPAWKPAAKRE